MALLMLLLLLLAWAARGGALRAAPPVADFSLQAVCTASRRLVVLTHDGGAAPGVSVRVASVTTSPSRDFHALSVPPTQLAPGGTLHVNVLAIPHALGELRGNLTVRFEGGLPDVTVPLTAIGIPNPFRVTAVTAVIPVGRQYSRVISVYNPHAPSLQPPERLRDAFVLDAPHLQLEVPTGYANVTSAPGGRPPHTWQLVATGWTPLASGVPPRTPVQPPPPTWAIPPGAAAEVVRVTVRPTQHAGAVADAHLHLQLSQGELIVPMSFTAVSEGVAPFPGGLDLGLVVNSHGMLAGSPLRTPPHPHPPPPPQQPSYWGYQAARIANRPSSFWGGAPPVARAWCVNATAVATLTAAARARRGSRGEGAAAAGAGWSSYLHCVGSELAPGAPSPAVTAAVFARDPVLRLPGGGLQRAYPALWHLYGSAPGWLAAAHTPGLVVLHNASGSSGSSSSDAAPLLVPVEVAAKAQRAWCSQPAAPANGSTTVTVGCGGAPTTSPYLPAQLRRFRWATTCSGSGSGGGALPPNALAVPNFPDGIGPGGGGEAASLAAGTDGFDAAVAGGGGGGGGSQHLIGMAHGHAVRDAGLYSAAYAAAVAVHAGQLRAKGGGSSGGGGSGGGGGGEPAFADRPLTPQHGPYRSVSLTNSGRTPVSLTHAYAAVTGSHWRAMNNLEQRVAAVLAADAQAARAHAATTATAGAPGHRHRAQKGKAASRHKHKHGKSATAVAAAAAAVPVAAAAAAPLVVWADTSRANATSAAASGYLQPLAHEWFTLSERRRASMSLPAGVVLHGDLYMRELGAGRTATVAAALHAQLFPPLFHAPQLFGPVHATSPPPPAAGRAAAAGDAELPALGAGMRAPMLLNGSLFVRTGSDSPALNRLEVPVSAGVLHGGLAYALEDTLFSPLDDASGGHGHGRGGGGGGGGDSVCVPLPEFALDLRSRLLTTLPPVTLAALTSAVEGGSGGAPHPPPRPAQPARSGAAHAALRTALLPLSSAVALMHAAVARAVLQPAADASGEVPEAVTASPAADDGSAQLPPPLPPLPPPCIPSDVRAITLHSGFARATMASPIFVAHPALHILRPDVESVPPKGGRITITVARHRGVASWRGVPAPTTGVGGPSAAPPSSPSAVRAVLAALAQVADVLRAVHSPASTAASGGAGHEQQQLDDDVRRAAGSLAAVAHDVLALAAAYMVRFGAAGGLGGGGGGGTEGGFVSGGGARNVMLRPSRDFVGSSAASALATTPLVRVWQFGGSDMAAGDPSQPLQPWAAPASAGSCAGAPQHNRTFVAQLSSRRLGSYLRDATARRLRHDQTVVTVAAIASGLHGDCAALAGNASLLGAGHASTAGFAGELLGCASLAFEPAPAAANLPWLRTWRRAISGTASDDAGGAGGDDGALATALRRVFTDASDALRATSSRSDSLGPYGDSEAEELRDRLLDALGASVTDVIDSLAIHALAVTTAGDSSTAAVGFTAPLTVLTDVGTFGVPLIVPASSVPSMAALLQPLPWAASPGVPETLLPLPPVPAAQAAAGVIVDQDSSAPGSPAQSAPAQRALPAQHLLHRLSVLHGFQLQDGRELLPVAQLAGGGGPPAASVMQLNVVLGAGQSTAVIDVVNREAVPVFLTDLAGGGDDPAFAAVASVWVAAPAAGGGWVRPASEALVVPPNSALTVVVELPPGGGSAALLNASGVLRFAARRTRAPGGSEGWFSLNVLRSAAAQSPMLRVETASGVVCGNRDPASRTRAPAHMAAWAALMRASSAPASEPAAAAASVVELEPIVLGGTRSGRLVLHNPSAATPLTLAAVSLAAPPRQVDDGLVSLLLSPALVLPWVLPPNGSVVLGTLRFSLSALCKAGSSARVEPDGEGHDDSSCLARTARYLGFEPPPHNATTQSDVDSDAASYWRRVAASGDAWLTAGVHVELASSAADGVYLPPVAVMVPLRPQSLLDLPPLPPPPAPAVVAAPLGGVVDGEPVVSAAAVAAVGRERVVVKLPPLEGAVHSFIGADGALHMRVAPKLAAPPLQWLYIPVVNHAAVAVRVALCFPSECSRVGGDFEDTRGLQGFGFRNYDTAARNISRGLLSSSSNATTPPVYYVPTEPLLSGASTDATAGARTHAAPARTGPCAALSTGHAAEEEYGSPPLARITTIVLAPRGGRALLGPVVFAPELSPAAAEALDAPTAGFELQLQLVNNLTGSEAVYVHAYLTLPSMRIGLAGAAAGSGGAQADWLLPLASHSSGDAPPSFDVHTWLHRTVNSSVAVVAADTTAFLPACELPAALAGSCLGEEGDEPLLKLSSHLTLVAVLPTPDIHVSVYHDTPSGRLSDALHCRLASGSGCSDGSHPPPQAPTVIVHGSRVGPALFEHRPVVAISASLSLDQARARCAADLQRLHAPGWFSWRRCGEQLLQLLESPWLHGAAVLRALESALGGASLARSVTPPSLTVNQTLLLSGTNGVSLPVRITLAPQHSDFAVKHLLLQSGVCEAVAQSQAVTATRRSVPLAVGFLHSLMVAAPVVLVTVLAALLLAARGCRLSSSTPTCPPIGDGQPHNVIAQTSAPDRGDSARMPEAPAAPATAPAVAAERVSAAFSVAAHHRGADALGLASSATPKDLSSQSAQQRPPQTAACAQPPAKAISSPPSQQQQQQQHQQTAVDSSTEAALAFLRLHPERSYADALAHLRGVTLAFLQSNPDLSYADALAHVHGIAGKGGHVGGGDATAVGDSVRLSLPASVVTVIDSVACAGKGGQRTSKKLQQQHSLSPRSLPRPAGPTAGPPAPPPPRIPPSPSTVSLQDARRSNSAYASSVSLSTMNFTSSQRASNASDIVSDDMWEHASAAASKLGGGPPAPPLTATTATSATRVPPPAPLRATSTSGGLRANGGPHEGPRQSAATASSIVRLRRPEAPPAPVAAATRGAASPPPASYLRAVSAAASWQSPSQPRSPPPPLPLPPSAPRPSSRGAPSSPAPAVPPSSASSPAAPRGTAARVASPSSSTAAAVPAEEVVLLAVRAQLLRSASVGDTGGSGSSVLLPQRWGGANDDEALEGELDGLGALSAMAPSFTPAAAPSFSPSVAAGTAGALGGGGYAPHHRAALDAAHPLASLWGAPVGVAGGVFQGTPGASPSAQYYLGGLVSTSLPPSPTVAPPGASLPPSVSPIAPRHRRPSLLAAVGGGAASGASGFSSNTTSRYSSFTESGGGGGGGGSQGRGHHSTASAAAALAAAAHGDDYDADDYGGGGGGGGDILLPPGGGGGEDELSQWPPTPQQPPLAASGASADPAAAVVLARVPSRSAVSQLFSELEE